MARISSKTVAAKRKIPTVDKPNAERSNLSRKKNDKKQKGLGRKFTSCPELAALALRSQGADELALAKWRSLCGLDNPCAAPTMANGPLLEWGRELCVDGVFQCARALCANSVTIRRLAFCQADGGPFSSDFRELRRRVCPLLRLEFSAFFLLFTATTESDRVMQGIWVVGVQAQADIERKSKRAKRRSKVELIPAASEEIVPVDREMIADAMRAMWSASNFVTDFEPPTERSRIKLRQATAYAATIVARACIPLDRAVYGHGLMRKLAQAIARAFKARAMLLDVAATAPLSAEAIASFLATLPADRSGRTVDLPIVRAL